MWPRPAAGGRWWPGCRATLHSDAPLDFTLSSRQALQQTGRLTYCFSDWEKGHALAKKAGARTDFSYVPGHLGEF